MADEEDFDLDALINAENSQKETPADSLADEDDLDILINEESSTTPIVETPIVETPVVETPVEETPVEETPVEETPVEETLVEETLVEEVSHSFNPEELALHEIDENMLVSRKSGTTNPHIEKIPKENVQKYEYTDMSEHLMSKKGATQKGKAEALKQKTSENPTTQNSHVQTNQTPQQQNIQFDDSKISKKLSQLGEGLRVGINSLKTGIVETKDAIGESKTNFNNLELNLQKSNNKIKQDISSEITILKKEITEVLEEVNSENKNLQNGIIENLKQIIQNNKKQKEEIEYMFEDLRKFTLKLIEKVIEKEVEENSEKIIKNTLKTMEKEFERIMEVTIYISKADEGLKVELENYIKSLYSSVSTIKILIDNNLSRGSFFFNTDNGNAQSILKDKIRMVGDLI